MVEEGEHLKSAAKSPQIYEEKDSRPFFIASNCEHEFLDMKNPQKNVEFLPPHDVTKK